MKNNMLLVPKTILITGFSLWMTIIVINHIFDHDTILHTFTEMFNMQKIIEDPNMGNGIEWRAIQWPLWAEISFDAIILFQCVIVGLLWRAAIGYIKIFQNNDKKVQLDALKKSNIAMGGMIFMWFLFMCGGLSYGYWMKMGVIQDNHFNFLIMTVVGVIFMNFDSHHIKESAEC